MSITKESIIPISTLKANVAEIVRDINADPIIITQNGSAKAVILSKYEYDNMVETMYMLKLVAVANQEIANAQGSPLDKAFKRALKEAEAETENE